MKRATMRGASRALLAPVLALALLAGGCASIAPYDEFRSKRDPLENFNRAMFGVNEALDQSVFRPLAKGYEWAVPELGRWMIGGHSIKYRCWCRLDETARRVTFRKRSAAAVVWS